MFYKSSMLCAVCVLLLSASGAAWAVKPVSDSYVMEDDFFIVECGDYDVYTLASTLVKETLYFNQDEEAIRYHLSLKILESKYYNSNDENIFIVQGKFGRGENASYWEDLVTGDWQSTGGQFRITFPGIGPLLIDVGRWHWDGENFYRSGAFIAPEDGTGSALCEALEP